MQNSFTSIGLHADLAGIIISYLSNDKSSLSACSLVCRTWVPFARRQIFKEVSLKFGSFADSSPGSDDMDPELLTVPSGEEAIWDENFWHGWAEEDEGQGQGQGEEDGEEEDDTHESGQMAESEHSHPEPRVDQRSTRRHKPAVAFLELLQSRYCTIKPNISHLVLTRLNAAEDVGEDPPAAILRVFANLPALCVLEVIHTRLSNVAITTLVSGFPQLTTLELFSMRLPVDGWALAARFPRLVNYQVTDSRWERSEDTPSLPPLTFTKLSATTTELVYLLPHIADFPASHITARVLVITDVRYRDISTLGTLFALLGGITELHTDLTYWDFGGPSIPKAYAAAIDLSTQPALHTLSFQSIDVETPQRVFNMLPRLLARAPAGLASLTLQFRVGVYMFGLFAWNRVDDALMALPGLQVFALEWRIGTGTPPRECRRVEVRICRALPRVKERGVLKVKVTS